MKPVRSCGQGCVTCCRVTTRYRSFYVNSLQAILREVCVEITAVTNDGRIEAHLGASSRGTSHVTRYDASPYLDMSVQTCPDQPQRQ